MTENTPIEEWERIAMGAYDTPAATVNVQYQTIDVNPTENSPNPVSSGGVFAALAGKEPSITYDNKPIANSENHVKSGAIYTAIQEVREIITPGYSGTDKPVYVYRIDPNEDDPTVCISYLGANAHFAKATKDSLRDWENTFIGQKIKPCVVKNGSINYWLDPTNIFKKANGDDAILTGEDGDAVVAIPTVYWKTTLVTTGWTNTTQPILEIEIAFSEGKFTGAKARAHRFGEENNILPWLFDGIFNGTVSNNKLRSVYSTTETPAVSQNIDTFQTQAAAGGTGYSIETFNTLTLINILFVAVYGTLDAQTVIGKGHSGGSAAAQIGLTYRAQPGGGAYGTTSATMPTRVFYMENRWGNVWNFIQGIMQDADNTLMINHSNTNFIAQNVASPTFLAADWTAVTGHVTSPTSDQVAGYIKSFLGADPAPFVPSALAGSSTTYATDYYYVRGGLRTCLSGGDWGSGAGCGVFYLTLADAPSTAGATLGARLQILSMGEAAAAA